MSQVPIPSLEQGEDIMFSATAHTFGGIKSVVVKTPPRDFSLWADVSSGDSGVNCDLFVNFYCHIAVIAIL